MRKERRAFLGAVAAGTAAAALVAGRAAAQELGSGGGLVGAWLAAASRPTGQGVVLLTFTSDGTFFRSADTHPVQSVGHGVWNPVGERDIDATYIALRFDENRAHIGTQKTLIRITVGPDGDSFTGLAKVATLALDGTVTATSQTQLTGQRIVVEPFDA
jgi:hypothetical protein